MAATVSAAGVPRGYVLAWCEPCGDGVRYSRPKATRWAEAHNAKYHPAAIAPDQPPEEPNA